MRREGRSKPACMQSCGPPHSTAGQRRFHVKTAHRHIDAFRCLEINVHAMTRCRPHFHRVPTHLLICAKFRICTSDYAQQILACGLHVAQSATHGISAQRLTFNSGPTTHEAPKTPTFIMIALGRRRTSPDFSEQSEHRPYLDIAITP